ncbi:MAG: prepilin-type N-terminal cleavage/methylation domain-containing protein [Planctomycetes bacterium]|nr:prepilin-type N-terminal cleavage/methylation domain-containing protein [Planctomycetota bacterium]
MRKLKKNGFTLVEILASVMVMTVVIVPFITFAANNFTVGMEIERKTRSNLLAEAEMEKIKNTLSKSFETDFTAWSSDLGNSYLVTRTSTDVSETLKRIGVSVGYDDDKNGSLGTDEIMIDLVTQYAKRN